MHIIRNRDAKASTYSGCICIPARDRRIKGSRTAIIIIIMLDIDWGSFDDEDGWIPLGLIRAYVCMHHSFVSWAGCHCRSALPPLTVGVGSLSVCDWLR